MAVDEGILATAQREERATLRLYRWRGPWLSLGYPQRVPADRLARCAQEGVRWVRRPTGGRAVLHGQDLTYALAAPASWLPPSLEGSYRLVSEAILAALGQVGIRAARAAGRSGRGGLAFDCFARPAPEEICIGRRKLVGSAQRRGGAAVLQHGSIRLRPDPPPCARAAGVGRGAISLADLGWEESWPVLRGALVEAFGRALPADLVPGSLTPAERVTARRRAEALRREARGALTPTQPSASRAPLDGR